LSSTVRGRVRETRSPSPIPRSRAAIREAGITRRKQLASSETLPASAAPPSHATRVIPSSKPPPIAPKISLNFVLPE
jgi:hypothetical protein